MTGCDDGESALLVLIFVPSHNPSLPAFHYFEKKKHMEHEIDGWIEQLSQCKQLPEGDVKKLCDKVGWISPPLSIIPFAASLTPHVVDTRDLDGRVQRTARAVSSDRVW